jgi:hypothetical protein
MSCYCSSRGGEQKLAHSSIISSPSRNRVSFVRAHNDDLLVCSRRDPFTVTNFDFCQLEADAVKRTYQWPGAGTGTIVGVVPLAARIPLRLDLHLYYSDRHGSSSREIMDVWPPFPIEICGFNDRDNLIAALEHRDRMCELRFVMSSSEWGKLD